MMKHSLLIRTILPIFLASAGCLPCVAAGTSSDTLCYRVARYGAKGDGIANDLPALMKAIEAASGQDVPVKVVFEPNAVYRIAPSADSLNRILLKEVGHFTVEGNGSTLLMHPSCRALAVYRSHEVAIRNFKLDYAPLPYTQGRVTKADPTHYYLEFEVDREFPLPIVGDESYYKGGKMVDCITANGKTGKFYQGHSWVKQVVALGNRTYGVHYALRDQKQLQTGDYFCMKIDYPTPPLPRITGTADKRREGEYIYTHTGTVSASGVDGLLLENITSYAAPAMTFVLKGCSRHVMRNCAIKALPGRIVAGNSDGVHMKGNEHQPLIEHSYFERMMDDAIHIKISGDAVTEVLAPNRFKIAHKDIAWDNTQLDKGKRILVFDLRTMNQLALCTIADYVPLNYREGIVTTDTAIEGLSADACIYLQATGEAVIHHCRLGTQLQRGILTHQPTRVHHCVIEDNGKGFELGLLSEGIEGPPTQRLSVSHCLFRNLTEVGLEVVCPSRNYAQGSPQLDISDCTFCLPSGVPVLKAKNSRGIVLKDNRIYIKASEKPDFPSLFRLDHSTLLREEGNTIKASPR